MNNIYFQHYPVIYFLYFFKRNIHLMIQIIVARTTQVQGFGQSGLPDWAGNAKVVLSDGYTY